ncbi:FKBP-type peptidyl-prolyl cis-trans isomerase [candidate division CSSED10-310 bacterium]|uniref:Peptidyl-prolyl cis-trans isomerase n=1 Tax=candidate division CSSED10-310 bacterium TaxID=2855610 RepID=A0ABV6Z0F4_UNCC1
MLNKLLCMMFLLSLLLIFGCTRQPSKPEPPQQSTPKKVYIKHEEQTLPSGLKILDFETGQGREAQAGNTVVVHYSGWLRDGTKFDSSYARHEPFEFKLGQGQVIQGWELGVIGMKKGGKRKLTVPPDLAYGEEGFPGLIPPQATLTFEIELLQIKIN